MHVTDLRATPRRVAAVARLAGLDERDTGALIDAAHPPASPKLWADILRYGMRASGSAFLVSAVLYGVAWNWSALGYLTRLGMAEGAFAIAAAAAVALGPTTRGGGAAVLAAGALIGPMLAQLGISYQTGADSWLLFAAWSALALPLAASARSGAVWTAWIVLLQFTGGVWMEQHNVDSHLLNPILAAVPLLAAAVLAGAASLPEGRPRAAVTALIGDSLLLTTPMVCADLLSRHVEVHPTTTALMLVATAAAGARLVVSKEAGGGALVGLVLIALVGSLFSDDGDLAAFTWLLLAAMATGIAAATGAAIRHFTANEEGE